MATIVNSPQPQNDSGGGMTMMVGILIILFLGFLFFYYGLPAIRQSAPQQDINVQVPQQAPADVNVDVPDQIDVNVSNPDDSQ